MTKKHKTSIRINDKYIGDNYPCFIIAEVGVNHNGSIQLAGQLIKAAKEAGADAVKFQAYKTEELVISNAPKAAYQKTKEKESQFEMLKRLELSESQIEELVRYCQKVKIMFLCTPFDEDSAEFLFKLNIPIFKIGSGEITNFPLIKQISGYQKPIMLSTGMSDLSEIREAIEIIRSTGNRKLILLHCTSNYPAKFEDVNLKAINALKREFEVPVGYSDHSEGLDVSLAAVVLGACVIEKHFTLDKDLPGPDHKASINPAELKRLVISVRNIETAMGDGKKVHRKSEAEMRQVARKSIVAAKNISIGTLLTGELLTVKRPGTGIAPKYFSKLIGKITKTALQKDQLLKWEHVK